MKYRFKHLSIFVLTLFCLIQCSGTPVPDDKKDYAGRWESNVMALTITPDGRVEYKRVDGGGSRSVSGPIKSWQGDDFEVGILFFSTVFKVEKKPYQRDGKMRMVVDGVELTKITF